MRSNTLENDPIVRLMQIGWLRNLATCSPLYFVPNMLLLGRDMEVKQTTKAMKEIAVTLLQPFSDDTCLEIRCIIVLYVHVWIKCNRRGMNVCQEDITHPIGAGSPAEKISEFQSESCTIPGQVTCSVFFRTLQGTLPLCIITGMGEKLNNDCHFSM